MFVEKIYHPNSMSVSGHLENVGKTADLVDPSLL